MKLDNRAHLQICGRGHGDDLEEAKGSCHAIGAPTELSLVLPSDTMLPCIQAEPAGRIANHHTKGIADMAMNVLLRYSIKQSAWDSGGLDLELVEPEFFGSFYVSWKAGSHVLSKFCSIGCSRSERTCPLVYEETDCRSSCRSCRVFSIQRSAPSV
jgi:hypothetical protein